MTRVLVGDTQRLFSQAFAMSLSLRPDFRVLNELPRSGGESLTMAMELKPDVMVVDYWMPDIGGAALAGRLRRRFPDTRVLLLCWFYGTTELHNALAAGAAGFLPKSVRVDDVASAIRRIAEGNEPVYPKEMGRLVDRQRLAEATRVWERLMTLTSREQQILQLLGIGQSSSDIASILGMQPSTARTHINRILSKLNARTQMEAVGIARHYHLIHP